MTADNWNGGVQPDDMSHIEVLRLAKPWEAMPIRQQTAEEAYEAVLNDVGATLPCRDAVDERIIAEVRGGYATYEGASFRRQQSYLGPNPCGIIDSQTDVGGWPELKSAKAPKDSDGDGLPDRWERKLGLDPKDGTDGAMMAENGYTHLENYLNTL